MPKGRRLFTFASGGWVLALAVTLTVAGTLWNLAPLFDPDRVRPRGDGRDPSTYGFDLTHTLVPRGAIVSSGMTADALPALVDPATVEPGGWTGRYLVPDDKVIGVVFGGEARAYPLRVLVWHEVVNDSVGNVPIVVTYSPLSHGIAVFDRRLGGSTLTFGVSGLLYQSNMLLYDRREGQRGESLWSQLQARAVSGPAAEIGRTLAVLPVALARWDDWLAAWPQTRVLAPIASEAKNYDKDVYGGYVTSTTLRFPVDPMPPEGGPPAKSVIFADASSQPFTIVPLAVRPGEKRPEVVGPSTQPVPGLYAFWFAWYATHEGTATEFLRSGSRSP
jgi:hypothetical protein